MDVIFSEDKGPSGLNLQFAAETGISLAEDRVIRQIPSQEGTPATNTRFFPAQVRKIPLA
jgi:hypothetical protein